MDIEALRYTYGPERKRFGVSAGCLSMQPYNNSFGPLLCSSVLNLPTPIDMHLAFPFSFALGMEIHFGVWLCNDAS
jgi:hypothetical protein